MLDAGPTQNVVARDLVIQSNLSISGSIGRISNLILRRCSLICRQTFEIQIVVPDVLIFLGYELSPVGHFYLTCLKYILVTKINWKSRYILVRIGFGFIGL